MVLAWLNHHYGEQRHLVWGGPKAKGGRPPARWVVNFDYDLLDGLVLATAMAAYCPWLVSYQNISNLLRLDCSLFRKQSDVFLVAP